MAHYAYNGALFLAGVYINLGKACDLARGTKLTISKSQFKACGGKPTTGKDTYSWYRQLKKDRRILRQLIKKDMPLDGSKRLTKAAAQVFDDCQAFLKEDDEFWDHSDGEDVDHLDGEFEHSDVEGEEEEEEESEKEDEEQDEDKEENENGDTSDESSESSDSSESSERDDSDNEED